MKVELSLNLETKKSATILVVSAYEQGQQPGTVATAAAIFDRNGHHVIPLDLSHEGLSDVDLSDVDVLAISCAMHTGTRLGLEFAAKSKARNPNLLVIGYGLYASLMADREVSEDAVDLWVGGEFEAALGEVSSNLADGISRDISRIDGMGTTPKFDRAGHIVPNRIGLKPPEHYAGARRLDGNVPVGTVEATRGCAHTCLHCPIPSVYEGKLRLVSPEIVLEDIENHIGHGARHITFTDPDFFNAVPHSFEILREMRRRHPEITFNATIKVEHLIEYEHRLPEMRDLGCLFITSAFESLNDDILDRLKKGHTSQDLELVLRIGSEVDIPIIPTWLPFTPWTSLEDMQTLLRFVYEHDLVSRTPPIQYAIRLLVPPRSLLEDVLRGENRLLEFDDSKLSFKWENPEVDDLQEDIMKIVEDSHDSQSETFIADTFEQIWISVFKDTEPVPKRQAETDDFVPGLIEAWFC